MQIIERENIDVDRWDALVASTIDSSAFSYSWYLDSTAENWCALVDSDYTQGIALPYTVRAGQEILYTPIFVRYLEILGTGSIDQAEIQKIRDRFKIIQITFRQPVLGNDHEEYVYQCICDRKERRIGSQAKRSLSKAIKNEYSVRQGKEIISIISSIQDQLEGKFTGLDRNTIDNLTKLFEEAANQDCLHSFEVVSGDQCLGGIICIRKGNQFLYVKGAVTNEAKKNGAMYLALDSAIEYALNNELIFDFGGSRVKGVKDFNHNLGGKDVVYFAYTVNNGPVWFKLARRIRNKWIKK